MQGGDRKGYNHSPNSHNSNNSGKKILTKGMKGSIKGGIQNAKSPYFNDCFNKL